MSDAALRKTANHRSKLTRSQEHAAWILCSPAMILLILFMILPFFMSVFYSFTSRQLVVNPKRPTSFVGPSLARISVSLRRSGASVRR